MRKIQIGKIFGQAYGLTFTNLGLFARVATVPFLLIVAMNLAVVFFARPTPPGWVSIAQEILSFIIQVPLLTSWHRFVLLPRNHALPTMGFNFTLREVRFFGYLVLMTLSFGAAFLFLGAAGRNVGVAAFLVLILLVVLLLLWARLCLVFPAAAVGAPVRLADSWGITRGNGWRIFWLTILISLPFAGVTLVMGMILAAIIASTKDQTVFAYFAVPMTILSMTFAGISAAAQSIVFRDLTDYDPATFEPA